MSNNMKNYRAMYNFKLAENGYTTTEDPAAAKEKLANEEGVEYVLGTVRNCICLNVREEPDAHAEIVCVMPVRSVVQVFLNEELEGWYHVCTAVGQEGYCMKDYVLFEQ